MRICKWDFLAFSCISKEGWDVCKPLKLCSKRFLWQYGWTNVQVVEQSIQWLILWFLFLLPSLLTCLLACLHAGFNGNFPKYRNFFNLYLRNGYLWTYNMFFVPRNPFMGSKILKNYGIVAPIGPEWAFLLFFGVFTHFLSLKNVQLNEKGRYDKLKHSFTFLWIIRKY